MNNGKCEHCKGTGVTYYSMSGGMCYTCDGTGENHYDGDLICNCCQSIMGYIGWECDMNGNQFICIECKNKGAYAVRTPNKRGGFDITFHLPE